jgi:hypothetical protein
MSIAKTFNQLMLELGYTKYVAQGDKRFEHVCCMCLGLMRIPASFGLAVLVFTSNVLSLAMQPSLCLCQSGRHVKIHACSLVYMCCVQLLCMRQQHESWHLLALKQKTIAYAADASNALGQYVLHVSSVACTTVLMHGSVAVCSSRN